MKRSFLWVLALLISLTLIACSPDDAEHTGSTDPTPTAPTNTVADSPPQETEQDVSTTEVMPDADVVICVPGYLLSEIDPATFDRESYIQEQGLLDAVLNEDGSMTITMSQTRSRELKADLNDQVVSAFNDHRSITSYIKKITSNENFSQITVSVDRSGYEGAFDITHIALGFPALIFQAYTGNEIYCDISIIDESGAILFQCTLPDAMSEW